jgi:RND family efflux transporter MFP subunit
MSKAIPVTLLAGALLALAGCGERSARKPKLAEIDRVPRLETIAPERRPTLTVRREYTATVEPLEKVDLCARVQAGTTGLRGMRGFIKTIPKEIDIGRQVGEGDLLIELELPDLAADRQVKDDMLTLANNALRQAEQATHVAAADIKEAEAQILRYQADFKFKTLKQKRLERLVKQDTVQPELQEEADLELQAAQAALQNARAQVTTKKARYEAALRDKDVAASKVQVAKSELNSLDVLTGFSKIRAPFPGVITKRWVNSGDTIKDAAMPLLTVMRTDVVRVLIDVSEPDVPFLRAAGGAATGGNPVILRVPALRHRVPGGQFSGQVTLTASSLDPVTRTMRVEIWLPNPNRYLLPQMTGTASVVLEERKGVFTVPSSALDRHGDKASVYCVVEAKGDSSRGVVRRVDVEVGVDDGETAEIRRGLTGTEQILAKGKGVVREGDFAIAVPAR